MKRVHYITIQPIEPQARAQVYEMAASNPHFAVREVLALAGRRGDLPRGWKRLAIWVSR